MGRVKGQRNRSKFGVLKKTTKRKIRETKRRRLAEKNDQVFVIKIESEYDNFEQSNETTIDFSDLIENQGSSILERFSGFHDFHN